MAKLRSNDTLYSRMHRRWYRKAETKVMAASPEYARIEAIRHSHPGPTIRFLDDELTMEHWNRQQKIFDEIAPWPWWLKVLAWREHNQITVGGIRGRIEKFTQRGQRGWSNQDAWEAHSYLADVISAMIRRLNENNHGYPADLTPELWSEILDKIAAGFEAANELDEKCLYKEEDKEERDRLEACFNEGFDLLHKHFFSLWD